MQRKPIKMTPEQLQVIKLKKENRRKRTLASTLAGPNVSQALPEMHHQHGYGVASEGTAPKRQVG